MTEEEYQKTYASFVTNELQANDFSEEQFRQMIRDQLLIGKLKEAMGNEVDKVADQVEAIYLGVGTEEEAKALQKRINEDGEDAETIMKEFQNDDDDKTTGFQLPWLPAGYLEKQLGPEYEKAAFETPVGQASDPIPGPEGNDTYYVIYIVAHEQRELSPELLNQAREEQYTQWLEQQKEDRVKYLDWEEAVIAEPAP
jgi:parvulin-like peptidyl-prolyl isomerase